MARTVLITGAAGGIGQALVSAFLADGWKVVATDRVKPQGNPATCFIPEDLNQVVEDAGRREGFFANIRAALGGGPLDAIVNNAAVQILGSTPDVNLADWQRTLNINLTAPFLIAQGMLPELQAGNGVVINIGSVHARATKREFVAYATSKAAIHGLTRAMAVDLGPNPRVLCVAPAAVDTTILREGFEGNPEAFAELAAAHPANRIADPVEIGEAVVCLVQTPFLFATGSTVWLDGGVLSRLHDPA